MNLEPWNLDDPFERVIQHNLKATIKMSGSLEAILRLCSSKYKNLLTIWERLSEDAAGMEASLEIMNKRVTKIKPHHLGPPKSRKMNQVEDTAFHAYFRYLGRYSLDYEDMLIHSKIMLDRIAFLISQIFDGKIRLPRKFGRQKHYFLNPENKTCKEVEVYARFMRERTKWFEPLLNVYRNEFITHNEAYAPFSILSNPGHNPRPIMTTFVKPNDNNALFSDGFTPFPRLLPPVHSVLWGKS
jgi:hypothetical protein